MKHIYIIKCKKCGMERERGSAKLGLCRKCYRALPENKAKENAYSRMWYIKHRESEIEKNREYRKMNKELFDWYHDFTSTSKKNRQNLIKRRYSPNLSES